MFVTRMNISSWGDEHRFVKIRGWDRCRKGNIKVLNLLEEKYDLDFNELTKLNKG